MASLALLSAMTFTSCDKEKEFTPAMPEAFLINAISFNEVDAILPLPVGMDSTLTLTITAPEELTDRAVVWTSSNEAVARVSQEGCIEALKTGTAIVSVTPAIGFGATASVSINVVPELIPAISLTLVNPREGETIYESDRVQLTPELLPADRTYSYLTWQSSDESKATVDKDGLVTLVAPGEVTISAYTHDHSGVHGSYTFQVSEFVAAEAVEIAPYTEPVCLSRGPVALQVSYTPADATLGSVQWSSSNTLVATVDNGVVTPVGFGTTTITATCLSTGVETSIPFTVESGWLIWDALNGFDGWSTSTGGASVDVTDDGLIVTMNPGSKYRGDLKVAADANNPVYFDLTARPVFGMRCSIPKGGNNTLDAISASGVSSGAQRCNDGIELSDGSRLIYFDLAALKKWDAGVVGFKLFQMKVADIPADKAGDGTYRVWWIRTFESVDEMKAFAKETINE